MTVAPSDASADYCRPGARLPTRHSTITRDAISAYCAASGDHNPIHHDDAFAAASPFGGVIAHGMLTLALASEMLAAAYGTDWLATGSLRSRFRGAARPGDALEAAGSVVKCETDHNSTVVTCNIIVRKADNDDPIITGVATVRVSAKPPAPPQRAGPADERATNQGQQNQG